MTMSVIEAGGILSADVPAAFRVADQFGLRYVGHSNRERGPHYIVPENLRAEVEAACEVIGAEIRAGEEKRKAEARAAEIEKWRPYVARLSAMPKIVASLDVAICRAEGFDSPREAAIADAKLAAQRRACAGDMATEGMKGNESKYWPGYASKFNKHCRWVDRQEAPSDADLAMDLIRRFRSIDGFSRTTDEQFLAAAEIGADAILSLRK